MSRRPLIVGNWKMYKTVAEAEEYIGALLPRVGAVDAVDIGICPPFTALAAMVDSARGSSVQVYAQNMHEAREGAFTGEISASMLNELDVFGVVIGHSERRQYFDEDDSSVALKLSAALDAGLEPIVCVGESAQERAAGQTERLLRAQVEGALSSIDAEQIGSIAIAYEPVWAIGTGLVATTEQAQEAVSFVRSLVADVNPAAAEQVRILYGGSVKPDNASELLSLDDVDGALVGGASLDPAAFAQLVQTAVQVAAR